jgi:flagellar basal body-associated protein FliL
MKKPLIDKVIQKKSKRKIINVALISIMRNLSLVIFIILASAGLKAQSIMELGSYMKQAQSSSDPVVVASAEYLESLIKEIQPTVYISSNITSNGESKPVCAEVKANDIKKLSIENSVFNQVELLTIVIYNPADLNFILDLSELKSFTNLKYVYFLCEFNCKIKQVQKLYIPKTGIVVFYNVSIPS